MWKLCEAPPALRSFVKSEFYLEEMQLHRVQGKWYRDVPDLRFRVAFKQNT